MRRLLRRSTLAVSVFAAGGAGLLGASVQGIAAVDDDLRAASREHRIEQQHDPVKRDCPKPPAPEQRAPSDLRF